MPTENNFQHDELSRKNPGQRLRIADLTGVVPPDSPRWGEAMAQHGTNLSQAGVASVVFLHGSIHGTDLFGMQRLDEAGGLKRGYSRGVSGGRCRTRGDARGKQRDSPPAGRTQATVGQR
ncbi:MAG: hypothetical protein IPK92_07495 [Nitrospira sp.]|nr:hypothetical protein [Nitrospira sp.]